MPMSTEVKIVRLKRDRIPEAVEVIKRAYRDAALEKSARDDLRLSFAKTKWKPTTFIALLEGKTVGTIQCIPAYINWRTTGIAWAAVDPSLQGLGIGKILMRHTEEYIRRHFWKGASGTILLVDGASKRAPGAKKDYYAEMGYVAGPMLHNGEAIMAKNFRPLKKLR